MGIIPLHLQRRFEERWAARFGSLVIPAATGHLTFRSQGPKRWCISRAEQYVGRPERGRKPFQGGPVTSAAHKRPPMVPQFKL
jgi:hypothetical protein